MNWRHWCASIAAVFAALFATHAESQTLMTCGASAGRGYYLKGDLIPAEKAGWQDDAITGGNTTLAFDGSDYDIIFRDASGMSYSTRSDGGTVVLLNRSASQWMVLVVYGGTGVTETYVFSAANKEVVWTQAKVGGLVEKVALFRAPCS